MKFSQFNGTSVLESTNMRKCAQCRRLVGKRKTSYQYGPKRYYADQPAPKDVCQRCHKRNFRRHEAAGQPSREGRT